MKERPSWTEYIQPSLMATASAASAIAACVAIAVGADKTAEGKTNPFFYVALSNSCIYAGANSYKCYQIYKDRCFVDVVAQSREEVGLAEIVVRSV